MFKRILPWYILRTGSEECLTSVEKMLNGTNVARHFDHVSHGFYLIFFNKHWRNVSLVAKKKEKYIGCLSCGLLDLHMDSFFRSLFSSTATIRETAGGWLGDRSVTSLDGVSFSEGDLLLQVTHTMYSIQRLIPPQFTYHPCSYIELPTCLHTPHLSQL